MLSMNPKPSLEEQNRWHKWFAMETNNRAWALCEQITRTPQEDREMLHAANASAYHWKKVGTLLNEARADLLLANIHAILRNGKLAMHYVKKAGEVILANNPPDWEMAFYHAILARSAFADGRLQLHSMEFRNAEKLGKVIADENDKAVFEETFKMIPKPA